MMTRKELVLDTLQQLGYRPSIDADGDVKFRHKMRTYYVQIEDGQEEEHPFLTILLPNLAKLDEDHIPQALLTCNKAVRNLKMVKMYVDENLSHVHASYEFYYMPDSLRENIELAMKILPIMSIWFRDQYQKLTD